LFALVTKREKGAAGNLSLIPVKRKRTRGIFLKVIRKGPLEKAQAPSLKEKRRKIRTTGEQADEAEIPFCPPKLRAQKKGGEFEPLISKNGRKRNVWKLVQFEWAE